MIFGLRCELRLPVSGPSARCEDDLLDACIDEGLKKPERSHDVELRVGGGVGHRDSHVDLRCVMIDEVEAACPEFLYRRRVTKVGLYELRLRIHVLPAAAAEI